MTSSGGGVFSGLFSLIDYRLLGSRDEYALECELPRPTSRRPEPHRRRGGSGWKKKKQRQLETPGMMDGSS